MKNVLLLLLLTLTLYAALPPDVIEKMQNEAEEYIKITISDLLVDSTDFHTEHKLYVKAIGIIDSVHRSENNSKIGDTINLDYIHRIMSYEDTVNGEIVIINIIGQGPPKIVNKDSSYYCYLNSIDNNTFYPAVYSASFTNGFKEVNISKFEKSFKIKNKKILVNYRYNLKGQLLDLKTSNSNLTNGLYLNKNYKSLLLKN